MQDHNIFGCKIYTESIFLGLNFTLHTHTPRSKYSKYPPGYRAAQIITGSDEWTPSAPLLETLGWKNVRELYRHKLVIAVFKSSQGKVPEYFSDLLPPSNMRESEYELRYTQMNCNMLKLKTNMGQDME